MRRPASDLRSVSATRSILIAWSILCVMLVLAGLPQIRGGRLPDPDDALRLVQLRDLIAGQGWFDLTQYRIDPPAGTAMHWSRLVDIPLLVIGALFGEAAALVVVPLLALGVVIWAVGRLAHRMIGGATVMYAGIVCVFMPPLVMQLQPMRIDHHGWQAACVALALLALSDTRVRRGGALAGLAMALGLTISVELLPLAGAFAVVLAARWWRDMRMSDGLTSYLQGLAIGLAGLFLATRGPAALHPWCDAISPPQLSFFAVIALGATFARRIGLTRFGAIAALGASGVLGLVLIGQLAPQCLAPPFADLDPLVRDYWYINIAEGQPVWRRPASQWVPWLVPMLAALGACCMLWLQTPPRERSWWTEHAALLVMTIGLGLLVARSLAFAAVISAVPLGWLVGRLVERIRGNAGAGAKTAAALILLVVLVPTAPVVALEKLFPDRAAERPVRLADADCNVTARAASLASLPEGVVFAPLDLGPSILLESQHAVVATSHHRAEAAMADVIAAFLAPPDRAREILARHGADYLALCTDLAETRIYARHRPGGLAATLTSGAAPDWLEPVGSLTTPEFKIYRIRPDGSAAPPR